MTDQTPLPPTYNVEGLLLPPHPFEEDWPTHIDFLRNMDVYEDDTFLLAYPKAGTHWMWEVCHMLRTGRAQYEPRSKEFAMVELLTPEMVLATSRPRVFNSHMPLSMLPVPGVRQTGAKLVHVYRNPKDTLVSQWFHFRQIPVLSHMTLSQFIRVCVSGKIILGPQPHYLRRLKEFVASNPDIPIFNVSFEQALSKPAETVGRIALFLGVAASEELCQDIANACRFHKLKESSKDKLILESKLTTFDQHIFRKGEVGDWKNHITVADNEFLDEFIAAEFKDLDMFPMQYTPSA